MEIQGKILLVEDDPELIKIVDSYLRDEGYDVHTARSGEEALQLLGSMRPDIVVSDVKMEPMDGFQLLDAVRKQQSLEKLPFIFLTIMDDRTSVERARELGAAGYITKPFDVEDLHQQIRSVIRR